MLLPRLLAGLLLAALLTACDAGDDPGPRPAPALPELESAWTAAGVTGDRAWLVGDLLVVAGKAGLTGLDRATGAVRWTRPLAPGICTTALAPNPDGPPAPSGARGRGAWRACRAIDLRFLRPAPRPLPFHVEVTKRRGPVAAGAVPAGVTRRRPSRGA